MRDFLRQSLLTSFSLYLAAAVYPGLMIPAQLARLLWAGLIFTLLNRLAKPLIKLILLPLNLLTLGLLSWVNQVIVLVLAIRILPDLRVAAFTTPPWQQAGFALPPLSISLWLSFILASLLINFIYQFLDRLLCSD